MHLFRRAVELLQQRAHDLEVVRRGVDQQGVVGGTRLDGDAPDVLAVGRLGRRLLQQGREALGGLVRLEVLQRDGLEVATPRRQVDIQAGDERLVLRQQGCRADEDQAVGMRGRHHESAARGAGGARALETRRELLALRRGGLRHGRVQLARQRVGVGKRERHDLGHAGEARAVQFRDQERDAFQRTGGVGHHQMVARFEHSDPALAATAALEHAAHVVGGGMLEAEDARDEAVAGLAVAHGGPHRETAPLGQPHNAARAALVHNAQAGRGQHRESEGVDVVGRELQGVAAGHDHREGRIDISGHGEGASRGVAQQLSEGLDLDPIEGADRDGFLRLLRTRRQAPADQRGGTSDTRKQVAVCSVHSVSGILR